MTISKNAARNIASAGPEFRPRDFPTTGTHDAVQFTSVTDGTLTIVQITLYGEIIGQGISRRHPKDARNTDLGMALAVSRAFMDAGTRYAVTYSGLLNPEDPSGDAVKELRKLYKKDARRRKDIRRKAAREQHRATWGWDHTDAPDVYSKATD